jgi:aldose 1-epimerase
MLKCKLLTPAFVFLTFAIFFHSCKQKKSGNNKNEAGSMKLDKKKFESVIDDKLTSICFLKNKNNFQAAVTNYGARMVSFLVPDKNGKLTETVIGFDNVHDFATAGERYFGAIVGRYGNRIAGGKFTLDGKTYQLDLNNGPNSLHGGRTGFHSRVWDMVQTDSQSVELTYISKDGEEGYPGNLTTKVRYRLNNDNSLQIDYIITTDKKTVINLTNHNYWNLNGEGSGSINQHQLMIKAANYSWVDSTLIPVGNVPVAGTPFDFNIFHTIGERINDEQIQLQYGKGYDHNFVLNKGLTDSAQMVASVIGDLSGIQMDIYTTEPGLQFYGGNFMQGKHILKNGKRDDFRTAFCLETQHFPDSPNQPEFPTTVLLPGKVYHSTTIHKFSAKP